MVLLASRILWSKGVQEFVDADRLREGRRVRARFVLDGLPVPPRDVPALADAIDLLIRCPDERRRMDASGRRIVETEFSAESVVDSTLAVYRPMRREVGFPGFWEASAQRRYAAVASCSSGNLLWAGHRDNRHGH